MRTNRPEKNIPSDGQQKWDIPLHSFPCTKSKLFSLFFQRSKEPDESKRKETYWYPRNWFPY